MSTSVRESFTLDFLEWIPWLECAIDTDLTPDNRIRVETAIGNAPNSDYIAVLANDYEAWQTRALVHRHVYTSEEPEPTEWRELAATTSSRINGCVFCASVHARIYASKSRQRDVAQRFLDDGVEADLPPNKRAVVDLVTRLTNEPDTITSAHLEPLRTLGSDDMAILDVINYGAFLRMPTG